MPDLNQAYTWAINTCNAPNVGYSQTYRNQRTVNGITYYDCSSFIWYALIAGGWDPESVYGSSWPFVTADMQGVLTQLGWHQEPIGGTWLPGDIVWKSGHVEMVYDTGTGDARTMGAHNESEQLPEQVSIRPYTASHYNTYTALWRYGSGDATEVGINIYVAAAIAANWWEESHLNAAQWEDGVPSNDWHVVNHGYGLGQWTNYNDPNGRLWQLYQYVSNQLGSMQDPVLQVNYFLDEDYWLETGAATGFANLGDFIWSTSQNLDLLTDAFCEGWEGIPAQAIRRQHAAELLTYIRDNAQDTSITSWITDPDNALGVAAIKNNAVMLYRLLNELLGGSYDPGGGGGTYTYKSHMPIWMMLRHTRI